MIYLASPYYHELESIRKNRVEMVNHIHAKLIKKNPYGYFYSPLSHSNGVNGGNEKYWLAHGTEMLKRCSGLIVIMQDGWQQSKGVKLELALAYELNLNVTFYKLEV
jgi:hypothetical protein